MKIVDSRKIRDTVYRRKKDENGKVYYTKEVSVSRLEYSEAVNEYYYKMKAKKEY